MHVCMATPAFDLAAVVYGEMDIKNNAWIESALKHIEKLLLLTRNLTSIHFCQYIRPIESAAAAINAHVLSSSNKNFLYWHFSKNLRKNRCYRRYRFQARTKGAILDVMGHARKSERARGLSTDA